MKSSKEKAIDYLMHTVGKVTMKKYYERAIDIVILSERKRVSEAIKKLRFRYPHNYPGDCIMVNDLEKELEIETNIKKNP